MATLVMVRGVHVVQRSTACNRHKMSFSIYYESYRSYLFGYLAHLRSVQKGQIKGIRSRSQHREIWADISVT